MSRALLAPIRPDLMRRIAPYLFVIFLIIALQAALILGGISPYLRHQLGDTDSYMRLIRVEALATDVGGWFDSTIPRMNAPIGDTLNWTRPLDVLILTGALPLVAYAGLSWHEAIYQAGSWLPLVLQILMALGLAWAAAPLIRPQLRPMLILMSTLLPVMIAYNMVARPDQQTLLLISIIMMIGWVARSFISSAHILRMGLYAGLWAGFGLWVTVEAQFSFLALTGLLGLLWLERGDERLLEVLEGLALGFFIMTTIGMLAERGAEWNNIRELDKISLSQLLGAAVNVGLWGFMATSARHAQAMGRLLLSLLWGGFALAAILFFAPELLKGPAGNIDPRIMSDFFQQIREMRPLWPTTLENASLMLMWLGVPLLALPLWALGKPKPLLPWLPFAGLTAVFTLAAFVHARFAQTAAPLACVLLIYAMQQFTDKLQRGRAMLVRALILLSPLLSGFAALAMMPEGTPLPNCKVPAIAARLNELPNGIVMAPLNYGPELLYFTPHSVIAGPYHRNTEGISDTLDFFGDGSDANARAILSRRGVRYVLSCPGQPDRPVQARQKALSEGHFPAWLAPISLPNGQDFRLYRVK